MQKKKKSLRGGSAGFIKTSLWTFRGDLSGSWEPCPRNNKTSLKNKTRVKLISLYAMFLHTCQIKWGNKILANEISQRDFVELKNTEHHHQ